MEGGNVWVSFPHHFAMVPTYACATQVSAIREMRPRSWVRPGLPGSCGVGFGPSFWGDGSIPHGVSFLSSILPWQRERRVAGGRKPSLEVFKKCVDVALQDML